MHTEKELREELDNFFDNILDYPCCKRYNQIVKLGMRLKDIYEPLIVDQLFEEYKRNGKFFNG
jgi:hypothetical protein